MASTLPPRQLLPSNRTLEFRWKIESPLHQFHEISFFAQDDFPGLHEGGVFAKFRIRLQAIFISLVRSQAVEGDHSPGDIIRSFVRQEISDEMSAAPGNDGDQIFGVLFEAVSLERIDLIADHA